MLRRIHRDERGSVAAEVAVVMPLLLLVVVGAAQFAVVHHVRSVAESAAVEGARRAAAEGATLEEGARRTHELLAAGLGDSAASFTVTVEEQGDVVVATASGEYPLFIPWVTSVTVPIEVSAEVWREAFRDGP